MSVHVSPDSELVEQAKIWATRLIDNECLTSNSPIRLAAQRLEDKINVSASTLMRVYYEDPPGLDVRICSRLNKAAIRNYEQQLASINLELSTAVAFGSILDASRVRRIEADLERIRTEVMSMRNLLA